MIDNDVSQREIYIVMDPQRIRYASLEVAVMLAERLKASISAHLVSNELLRQVAQLPFTTEILSASGLERNIAPENIDYLQQQKVYLIQKLLEQRAKPRKVAFRLESSSEKISLQLTLESHRDLFLPSVRRIYGSSDRKKRGASPLATVKWVYDNCSSSERCFGLLQDLALTGLTRRIFVYGNKAIPTRMMARLKECGARVYWIEVRNIAELQQSLQAGTDVDLILLPASFSNNLGDERLHLLNQRSIAPILVIG